MLQRISHGAHIDAATPHEIAQIVAAVSGGQETTRKREKGTVNLDNNGNGQKVIALTRQYSWIMERVTIGGNGAANALVALYENDPNSDAELIEVIGLGVTGKYSDGFANKMWIAAGNRIYVVVTGGVAGGQITFNFQVELVKVPE